MAEKKFGLTILIYSMKLYDMQVEFYFFNPPKKIH